MLKIHWHFVFKQKKEIFKFAIGSLNPGPCTEEEFSNEAMDQERDPNMTYESSKRNSPNTQQSTATPPLSSTVPASSNDSSNRIKDDPYNFSEEEDVFSPQLPSRQFSSSNANIPGSDSNDPALERLKAENR